MPSLLYETPDGSVTELLLHSGVNRVGRGENNQILVPDPSVSTQHCEVRVENGNVLVQDLGSTNGTAIDGKPLQEGMLRPGGVLRLGNVEFRLKGDEVAIPTTRILAAPQAAGSSAGVCLNHTNTAAEWRCSKCGALFCNQCITDGRKLGISGVKFCPLCSSKADSVKAPSVQRTAVQKTFGAEMLAAWKYPFRGNGFIILIAGTIFFALAGFAQNFMFLIGGLIFVFTTGYWLAYAQNVVSSSANGDDKPPAWPDLSDFIHDILMPFFQGTALFVIYLLPFFLALWKLPEEEPLSLIIAGGLLLLALFMMPMAWLAVSMHESIAGVSPHYVLRSILRIPGQYAIVFIELVILVIINIGLGWRLDQMQIPIIPWLLNSFLGLYFMMVMCRILGVLYYLNRNRLSWF
jgi:hypothetical protein